jgi:HD-GYP domain-containing protein (c-di-GMP phosphodiesterase class II)
MNERTRRGGDDAEGEEARFQHHAAQLIGGLFVLVKLALVHKMDNSAVLPAIRRFRVALEAFQTEIAPEPALQLVGDAIYVNQRLVRADLATWERAGFLKTFFARMRIAEIVFEEGVPETSLREFLQEVREVAHDATRVEAFQARAFTGLRFRNIDAAAGSQKDDPIVVPDKLRVLRGYGVLVVTIREILEAIRTGAKPSLLGIRRAMQDFVRLPESTRPLQLGLLGLEAWRGEHAGRLANVGILVVLMGQRLGMKPSELRDLGVAAALAGIGRSKSDELFNAEPEAVAAQDAWLDGVRWLTASSGRGRVVSLRVIAAAEQARPADRRGGHPLSRLVAVADRYESWTQRRPRGPGLSPDVALHRLLEAEDLDRAAARLLVCTLGLFPVGSTVRLSTGETAVVVDVGDDPRRVGEPRVMVVSDADGKPADRRVVDLAGSGRAIIGSVDAAEIDLNVGHFLFA